jgi:hypothetical protein
MGTAKSSKYSKADHKTARDAYVRWQKTKRDQLGSVVKLVLTLTGAAVAFGADMFVKRKPGTPHAAEVLLEISLAILILAMAAGLFVNLTRLRDFLWTERAARMREYAIRFDIEDAANAPCSQKKLQDRITYKPPWLERWFKKRAAGQQELEATAWKVHTTCRENYEWHGKWTWRLLVSQFLLFALGILLLVIGVSLFPAQSEPALDKALDRLTATVARLAHFGLPGPSPPEPNYDTYTVQPGDNLSNIAKNKYHDWRPYDEIYQLNKAVIGANPNVLYPGQRLKMRTR